MAPKDSELISQCLIFHCKYSRTALCPLFLLLVPISAILRAVSEYFHGQKVYFFKATGSLHGQPAFPWSLINEITVIKHLGKH